MDDSPKKHMDTELRTGFIRKSVLHKGVQNLKCFSLFMYFIMFLRSTLSEETCEVIYYF
ncbi:hypothetical protein DCAR_0935442 [Daucus carota subsp. sativus]|uniref:Uncharacterized protein n=1 Tax=Daucus carota subsp. sativus TaxID=79200 RepID=A0AAF0XXN9_DAUCS|nr:hypothetical protein DCAR_0935442 [Daucus carota subsp. sativus]